MEPEEFHKFRNHQDNARVRLESLRNGLHSDLRGRCECLLADQKLLDERLLSLESNRLFRLWAAVSAKSIRMWRRAGQSLLASPLHPLYARIFAARLRRPGEEYARWVRQRLAALPSFEEHQAIARSWRYRPSIGIVLPAGGELRQSYTNWHTCTAPDSSDYIAFAGPGDVLSPFALHYVVESMQAGAPDIVYTDEDRLAADGSRVLPVLKPGWSPELLRSCMYVGRLLVMRRELYQSGPVHDLLLRLAERNPRVIHVPRVLYHRRSGWEHSMPRPEAKLPEAAGVTVIICTRNANLAANAVASVRRTAGAAPLEFVVVHHEEQGPNERMRRIVDGLGCRVVHYTGPFHFSLMNNLAAEEARTPYLLFLNDDVTAVAPGWCERIVAELARPEIGVAGAVLRYPSGALQHAGIVLGMGGGAGHAGRSYFANDLWPWLTMTRDVSAVTGACLGVRTELFRRLGGFSLEFPNNFNDVDFCLRVRQAGYRVICVAGDELVHRECATRTGITRLAERERFQARWGGHTDPFYSPLLDDCEEIVLRAVSP